MPDVLTVDQAAGWAREGNAVIVDLRSPADFGAGHPRGAINVPYDARHLAERLAKVVPHGTRLILVGPGDDDAEAERQAAEAFEVSGSVPADEAAWTEAGVDWVALPGIESAVLSQDAERRYHVVDVREPMEWETGHVPGAQLIALDEIRARADEVPRDREVAVICEGGVRSSSAASVLQAAGFEHVYNVVDGTGGYRRAGHPLETTPADEGGTG